MLDGAARNKDVRKFVTHNWSGNHIGGDGLSSFLVLQHTTTGVGVCVAAHDRVHEDTKRNNDDDEKKCQCKDHPSPEKLIQHVFIHAGSRSQLVQANLSITFLGHRNRAIRSYCLSRAVEDRHCLLDFLRESTDVNHNACFCFPTI